MIVDFDPLRKVFFEQQPPEDAFVKTHTDTGPAITRMADSPLNKSIGIEQLLWQVALDGRT